MPNTLAISAVTATLRDLLIAGVHSDPALSDAEISTVPVQKAPKNENANQLNIFLYQATTNTGWSNADPPTAHPGESPRPVLALDLHYLLTVFGKGNDEVLAHRVLGRAMRVLHDHPVLGRQEIRNALAGNDLGEQIERVRITPEPLSLDEMSKLWNSFQKEYRMSTAYQVSVVLIESARGARTPLPVLTRGAEDTGPAVVPEPVPPFPTLERALPPDGQAAVRLGETVVLQGHHLDGDAISVLLSNRRLAEPVPRTALPGATASEVRFELPSSPTALPAGLYSVSVVVSRTGEPNRKTNEIPLAVAPELLGIAPNPAARNPAGTVTLTATCRPQVLPAQSASLLLGSREVAAGAHAAPTGSLTFTVAGAPVGVHWLRLRVDGVDSLLVDRSVEPPVFNPTQKVTIT